MFLSACRVCAYASPAPTTRPEASVAVVPEMWTVLPTRTAREYPTIGSHGVPLEIFCRTRCSGRPRAITCKCAYQIRQIRGAIHDRLVRGVVAHVVVVDDVP